VRRRFRIVGRGRAGGSLAAALTDVGWSELPALGRGDNVASAAAGVDLVVVAVPDAAIAEVSAAIEPAGSTATTVIAHLAGSLGLAVLEPHPRRAAVHPLVALPAPDVGARRLRDGAWFAVAGDPMAREIVEALGGRAIDLADEGRAAYHAAACVASNHLVALLGQVERLAEKANVPLEAYLDLVASTVDNVAELGPAAALTGPAARGDEATLSRHREVLGTLADADAERAAYDALVELCRRLARS